MRRRSGTPRIAQLANFVGPNSGGMRTAIETLARGYVDAGAERLLIVGGKQDDFEQTPLGPVVTLRGFRVLGGYHLIYEPWRVAEVLDHFQPTSLEVSDKSTLLPVTGWAKRNGVGCALFSHERLDAMLSLLTGWETTMTTSISVWNRLLVRRFGTIVVTSGYAEHEFGKVARSVGTPLHRVPLGVDLDTFSPERGAPADNGVINMVLAGRLSREKSPQLAIATVHELHRRGVPVHLDVYGTGPHVQEMKALARGGPITFHGYVDGRVELARRLACADVALSVCPGETFGLAVLEALACGTPVVTSSTGGARELVDDASGAWPTGPSRTIASSRTTDLGDASALADAVLRVMARPEAERRAAARARAEKFPWSTTIASMLDLHRRLGRLPSVATTPASA